MLACCAIRVEPEQVIQAIIFSPILYFMAGFSSADNGGRFFTFMVVGEFKQSERSMPSCFVCAWTSRIACCDGARCEPCSRSRAME